ncbi:lipoprotein [Comamonas sp. GB3 AK4-5]|uniref:lipoprotein n=1 Tax=Comamonas sp. GB3 AK4-5 TaxID=3231487 RepID=UPI00284B6031|nr:lipoprotein [Acidovorax sp.]
MKKILALAAAAFVLSGCAVYHDRHGDRYDDGYKKPHPHGCPPGQAKKGNC